MADMSLVDMADMSLVVMAGMRLMVVAELTCGKGGDEDRKSEEYADALPAEVSFAVGLAAFLLFVVFMIMPMIASVSMHFKSFTVSLYAAVFMMVFFTAFCVPSVVYPVCNDTHNYSDYEQHCKQDHCLLWNHRKHDKRLVA